jgi:hypothetical protein
MPNALTNQRTDAELEALLGDPEPWMTRQPILDAAPEQYNVMEVNRDGFDELVRQHKAGTIRMSDMETGTCFGLNRTWLWRVSFERMLPKEKVLVQPALL